MLLVPVYQPQQRTVIAEAEGYAQGYESKEPLPPPPPPPHCQPCQQYQVIASAPPPPPPQLKPIFQPSAAFYAGGSIGLGAYFTGNKVTKNIAKISTS